MPGTSAAACAHPTRTASVQRSAVLVARPLAEALGHEHGDGADGQRSGRHGRRAQRLFDRIGHQHADDDDRQRADDDHLRQPAGRRRRLRERLRGARTIAHDVGVEERQDRRERADVQRHVERQAELGRRLPAEERPREDQVRRARDRQELGESLDDPEEDGSAEDSPRAATTRGAAPGFRASACARSGAAADATCPFIGLRPCSMIAIAAAMNTVE